MRTKNGQVRFGGYGPEVEALVVRERNGLRLIAPGRRLTERLRLARQRERRTDRMYLAVVTAAAVVMLLAA